MALGGGFTPDALLEEVRSTWAYRDLSKEEWAWALGFVRHGGLSLTAYPDYRHYTAREYGTRIGVYRLLDAFTKAGVTASWMAPICWAKRVATLFAR